MDEEWLLSPSKTSYKSPTFNVESECQFCVQSKKVPEIRNEIEDVKTKLSKVTDTTVDILKKQADVFISISKLISSFEREFSEFPQKN